MIANSIFFIRKLVVLYFTETFYKRTFFAYISNCFKSFLDEIKSEVLSVFYVILFYYLHKQIFLYYYIETL